MNIKRILNGTVVNTLNSLAKMFGWSSFIILIHHDEGIVVHREISRPNTLKEDDIYLYLEALNSISSDIFQGLRKEREKENKK